MSVKEISQSEMCHGTRGFNPAQLLMAHSADALAPGVTCICFMLRSYVGIAVVRVDPYVVLNDPTLAKLLRQLHARSNRQMPRLWLHVLPQLPHLLLGRPMEFSQARTRAFEADKYLAIQPNQGALCYLTALGVRAQTIVEFGTSFGVSTIWLAAAVRTLGRGRVIGTEIVPEKAEQARKHLAEAGLSDWVEIRTGDARETLREIPEPVDLMLNDGSPTFALEILQLVAPKMRPGSAVITDNVGTMPANYQRYLAWIRDPANGFASTTVPYKFGTELSVRV